ncbi:MAG TPA: histidine--tRNA ligase, partial [Sphingomicrobium sp.]|nr:histidine--tRNA ligase [Sphingomicrobium sp.]
SGNSKRQAERARREGVDAVLFVRDALKTRNSLHLSHSPESRLEGTDFLLKVLAALGGEIRQLSGDDLS